jgi:hypothetical protein
MKPRLSRLHPRGAAPCIPLQPRHPELVSGPISPHARSDRLEVQRIRMVTEALRRAARIVGLIRAGR